MRVPIPTTRIETLKFHVNPAIEAALAFAGLDLSQDQASRLADLAAWLDTEAITAGGIGPAEAARIHDRHLAGSIVYAGAWDAPPGRCWDLGAGIGLPGLVLAIVWPECRITLVDRSSRRIDLARRAARVIGVAVDTRAADIGALAGSVEAVVSRAAIPAAELLPHLRRILSPGGLAVVSGSGIPVPGYEELRVPVGILDHAPRLLMMRAS